MFSDVPYQKIYSTPLAVGVTFRFTAEFGAGIYVGCALVITKKEENE